MKAFIHSIDTNNKLFYCVINHKLEAFYLSNRLAKIFLPIIKEGLMIDFEVTEPVKRRVNRNLYTVYPVSHFNQIIQLKPRLLLYDLKTLRQEMKKVLKKYQYYLFLDLEMSMPGYTKGPHTPEILQVGYILQSKSGEVILDNGYYVVPKNEEALNKRTRKFLNIDDISFFSKAREYEYFYEDLDKTLKTYKPQIVTWGKNDIQALNISYQLHDLKPLTHDKQFIDLLKLHKDYFNLPNDLGLFDAYKKYYAIDEMPNQDHDARTDAIITK